MNAKAFTASGVSLGSITSRGVDRPTVVVHVDSMSIPETLYGMLPVGALGIPVANCSYVNGVIRVSPTASNLSLVDDLWVINIPDGMIDVFEEIVKVSDGRVAVSLTVENIAESSDNNNVVKVVEIKGKFVPPPPVDADAVLFKVGFWLAAAQLAAESSSGFGHTRVAAGLAGSSLNAAEDIQAALTRALGSLTPEGRGKFDTISFPPMVPEQVVRHLVNGTPVDSLFGMYGPEKTTIASVWVLGVISRLLVRYRASGGHSVATLTAEWIGAGEPWWMWKAVSISLSSYEDSVPVSVLESTASGAVDPLFWWLHELSEAFEAAENERGRANFVKSLKGLGLRPVDVNIPMIDFAHVLLASPRGKENVSFCGLPECRSCEIAKVMIRSNWDRKTVSRCAVWGVLLLGDLVASWHGCAPGDDNWSANRSAVFTTFTGGVNQKMLDFTGKAS